MSSKNLNKNLKKTNTIGNTPINTEKLYWFRKLCEEAINERDSTFWKALKNSFKAIPTSYAIQNALQLLELYEETTIEQMKKNRGILKKQVCKIKKIKVAPSDYERKRWNKFFNAKKN